MDNKKPESYEETHKKLAEALQEACSTKEFGEYKIPEMDLSFLEDDCIFDESEELPVPEKNEKKKHFHFSRFTKVAAIIVILLLSINILMLATDSTDSYGNRGIINKIVGVFTDDEGYIEDNEVIKTYVITNEDEMFDMVTSFPELYVPNYLPNEFELNKLIVEFTASGDCRAKYKYVKGKKEEVLIGLSYAIDSMEVMYSADEYEKIKLEDRIICIYQDVNNDGYVADVYFDDCVIDIVGLNNKNELIEIAKEIKHMEN